MQTIVYNSVELKVLQLVNCQRTHMYDAIGVYIYTRWDVEVICQYQPAMTSFAFATGLAAPGKLPGETDAAIIDKLARPQQRLSIVSGGFLILDTPALDPNGARYSCDAKNGPFCEVVNVSKMVGVKHWTVHAKFTAHVNNCTELGANTTADMRKTVLSNTWTSMVDVDELFYPTITVAGKAILRTDFLRRRHITADDFREDFFFPVPANYVREHIQVHLSEDGAVLDWSFTDTGRCYNVSRNSPIRKAEIFKTTYASGGSPSRAMMQWNKGLALGSWLGVPALFGAMANPLNFWGAGQEQRKLLAANLPQYSIGVRADLWGERSATNIELTSLALSVCLGNALLAQPPFRITQGEVIVRQELTNRFVSAEVTYRWGDDLRMFPGLGAIPGFGIPDNMLNHGGAVIMSSIFHEYSEIPGLANLAAPDLNVVGALKDVMFQQTAINPPLPVIGQVENAPGAVYFANSAFIESLVVQLLKSGGICEPVTTAQDRSESPNKS